MDILEVFKDPSTIHTLTQGQKFIASLMVTVLGMGVTFVGLIAIQYMMQLTSIIVRGIENRINRPVTVDKSPSVQPEIIQIVPTQVQNEDAGDITEELIAVITAAIASSLDTHTSNIVVKNIRRVNHAEPAWANAGRAEQLNSRF